VAELTNNDRARILAAAMYPNKKWWVSDVARAMGLGRIAVQRWLQGTREPTDQSMCKMLKVAKKQRDALDKAIERVTLYPWIR
jgi:transcriptional regulator with XRE-family HTH domain